jgi:hypothetical protein
MIGSNERITIDAQLLVERLGVPEIHQTMKRISGQKFHLPANFLSGLLLTTGDFKRVASGGVVYEDDRSDLRYSAGQRTSSELVADIHDALTPWPELDARVLVYQDLSSQLPKLEGLREMLMVGLYRGDERCRRFLRYIEEVSAQKEADYRVLVAELRSRGDLSVVERETLELAEERLAGMRAVVPEGR